MTAANQIVQLGLKGLGYEYVNSEFAPFPLFSTFPDLCRQVPSLNFVAGCTTDRINPGLYITD